MPEVPASGVGASVPTECAPRAPEARGSFRVFRRRAASTIALAVALAVLGPWPARGSEGLRPVSGGGPDSCSPFDHGHAAWTSILERAVRSGLVDYAGLKTTGEAHLDRYLGSLQSVCRRDYDTWTREQKLAYWINAYNAYTVRLVLDHYPVESIRSIGLLPGSAFRTRFVPSPGVRGRTLSLNDIEHEILRKEFREPRIHFAIVCASRSCPVLPPEAFRAEDLGRQLDAAARTFLRDTSRNRFDRATGTLHLSSIFEWFREDFEREARTLPEFVARYADEPTAAALRSGSVRIAFLDYDWSLNGR